MSLVKLITSRTVTFDHQGNAREAILDTTMSWETLVGLVKLLFGLVPPFVLSFETKRGAHLEIKHVGTLKIFLASNYERHIIDINRNVPLGHVPYSNKGANNVSQKDSKAFKKFTPHIDQKDKDSKSQSLLLIKERNAFDIMEEERTKNKNVFNQELSDESSTPTDSHSEVEVFENLKDPYTSFHEEYAREEFFVGEEEKTKEAPSKASVEQAKTIHAVCCDFKKLFQKQSSVLLLSEILFDQILHGVHIDTSVLERGLQRLAISTCGYSQMVNDQVTTSPSTASSSLSKKVASKDQNLYNEESGSKDVALNNTGKSFLSHASGEQFERVVKHYKPKTKQTKENRNFSFSADIFK